MRGGLYGCGLLSGSMQPAFERASASPLEDYAPLCICPVAGKLTGRTMFITLSAGYHSRRPFVWAARK